MLDQAGLSGVSTRSRPKAAGWPGQISALMRRCFNTQPPEGGWESKPIYDNVRQVFQHAAARRRLDARNYRKKVQRIVSTRSRPKAAGAMAVVEAQAVAVSTRSRPKAAGVGGYTGAGGVHVSTRSRPKAAGSAVQTMPMMAVVSTRSRPKAAGSRKRCCHRG